MNMISKVTSDGEASTRCASRFRDRPTVASAPRSSERRSSRLPRPSPWTSDPSPAAAPPTPPGDGRGTPSERGVNLWDDYVGRFEASRTVEVRPRVSGQIVGIHFTDGAIVQKGQLLFTVDPRPFAAALAEARAGVATRAKRTRACRRSNSAAPAIARGRRRVAGECRPAAAQVRTRQRRARRGPGPSSAACARRRVHAHPGADQRSDFRPQDRCRQSRQRGRRRRHLADDDQRARPDLLHLRRVRRRSTSRMRASGRQGGAGDAVEIRLQDEATTAGSGRLDFTDNGISQQLGNDPRPRRASPTATVPDARHVRQHAAGRRRDDARLLVPDAAVRTDQARKIVLMVGKDDTVAAKPVETGPLVGGLRVIRSGLTTRRPGRRPGRPVRHARREGEAARDADHVAEGAAPKAPPRRHRPAPSQATLAAR